MALILALETATQVVGVAVADADGVIASVEVARGRRHAETLVPAVEFACHHAGVSLGDVDAIAVDIGPGLFTGLRVGLATAKGLAVAKGLPLIGVASTDVLAHGTTGTVAVVLDARRGEVYAARYEDGQCVRPPWVASPASVADEIRGVDVVIGDGPARHPSPFAAFRHELRHPSPVALASVAGSRPTTAADAVQLLYLRAPDAEINFARWKDAPR